MFFVFIDTDIHQRTIDTFPHFLWWNPNILQTKCDIFLHHSGNDLVVRVLEYHADFLTDIIQLFLICGIHPININLAAGWEQNRVEMLCEGALSRAVMSQYRGQFALMNGHIQIFKHADRLLSFFHMVAEADPLCFDKIIHSCFLPPFFEFEDAILS